MDFVMTSFMYPLGATSRPRFFGELYFDNPRTQEEVEYVSQKLRQINLLGSDYFPDSPEMARGKYISLMDIYDRFILHNCYDDTVREFDRRYGGEKDIYAKLARMWVVVRSENVIDGEDTKGYFTLEIDEKEERIEIINDLPHSAAEYNCKKISDYFALICFLLSDAFKTTNLIVDGSDFDTEGFYMRLLISSSMAPDASNRDREKFPYGIFKYIEPRVVDLSNRIGERYDNEKFLFLCKKIHHMFDLYNIDHEMAFVEIIGVIEMLLAHKPDGNRFNVEDSITRQFIGKLMLLLYERDRAQDLKRTKQELRFAYQIRSDIAHGSFDDLKEQLDKLFDFFKFQRGKTGIEYQCNDDALVKLCDDALNWLRITVNLYLDDEKRLELLKTL